MTRVQLTIANAQFSILNPGAMSDLRYAFRRLRQHPGFAVGVALTLALGIGANSAVFSALNAVLLRPPPYKEPDRLVWLFASNPRLGYQRLPPNWANETFSALLEQNVSFEQCAKMRAKDFVLPIGERSEQVRGMRASANLFDLLGVQPALGRSFWSEENEWGRHRVVILSHEAWQRRFGGNPDILNQTIDLIDTELSDRDGAPHDPLQPQRYTVVGILPPRWQFPTGAKPDGDVGGFAPGAEIWEPESLTPAERQVNSVLDNIVARLRPGVTLPQARAEIQSLFRRLRENIEETDPGYSVELLPLSRQVAGNAPTMLSLLAGATGFVLLIACVNVANLLLARATARRKEFAVRAALGAGRARIIRQLIVESVVLSLAGGGLGLLLALGASQALAALANLPRVDEITLDARVFLFTFSLSVLTGLAFGLVPALQASKADLNETLKDGRQSTPGRGRNALRSALIVAETASALVLLVGAGLLIHSFVRLHNVDPGFAPQRVLARHLSFRHPKYRSTDVAVRLEELLQRLRAIPGILSVAVGSWLPIDGGRSRFAMAFQIEGRPAPTPGRPEELTVANMSFVTPDYFQTMGIPLLKGRDFLPSDLTPGAPAAKIVSESFVRKFLPGEEPLGKRVAGGEIVGVVKDTREAALDTRAEPHLYHAGIHTGPLGLRAATLAIRTSGNPSRLASSVEAEVLMWDKDQPADGVTTVRQILAASIAERRFQMILIGLFGALALLLAALGIYSVMAYLVTQRTHEIGIRMALGARRRDILNLIVGHGMLLTLTGVGIGLAGSFALTRVIASQLYEVGTTDPAAFAGVSLLLAAVAFFACCLPARRAARVDPMVALRYE